VFGAWKLLCCSPRNFCGQACSTILVFVFSCSLTYKAWKAANADKNPLTVRVIFDSLNVNADACEPDIAQAKLDSYREDLANLRSEILSSRLKGFGAVGTLVALLALAVHETFAVFAVEGWFYGWPGFENFPFNLFDPEKGLAALSQYYLSDDLENYLIK